MDKTKPKKESPAKTDSKVDKNIAKKSSEKKNGDQSLKKYAVISPESISLIADGAGITDLTEEAVSALAEDVSYRLREVVHNCSNFLNNTKRRKLTTDDVNLVLETLNIPKVYGHSVPHAQDFVYIPKAEVFVENDIEIDVVALSTMVTTFTKPGNEYVKGTWLLPDPVEKAEVKKEEPSTSTSTPQPPKPTPRPEEQHSLSKPPPHFINYYLQVARVVIGGSEPHIKVALADLRSNSKIGPLVPYFLNLVALSVNKLQRYGQLTDALLRTVEALVDNPYVDPSSQLAVNRAVNALLVIAIEPKTAKKCDDLLLRNRAAQLLARVLICWSIELKQQMDIVRQLLQLLLDGSISLKSHYGAVATLTALGQKTLHSYFWPILDRYVSVLEEQSASNMDAQDYEHIRGAIVVAYERMYKRKRNLIVSEDYKRWQKVERKLYDFLGDTLVPRYHLRTAGQGSVFPAVTDVSGKAAEQPQPLANLSDLQLRESLITACVSHSHSRFTFQPEVRGTMPKLHMYSVFSLSHYAYKQPKEILFNFIGSNQKPIAQLKRRKIGETIQRELKSHHFRFAQIWRLQTTMKKTRSIKYCCKSFTKSSVGDLFGFI